MTNYRVGESMLINPQILKQLITEELTKSEVKDIVAKEVTKQLASRDTKRIIEDELGKLLGKSKAKDEIAEAWKTHFFIITYKKVKCAEGACKEIK